MTNISLRNKIEKELDKNELQEALKLALITLEENWEDKSNAISALKNVLLRY